MDSVPTLEIQSFNSQVPNSCASLSCPSEPPDVGNWFSSYNYCSPDPDSNIGLEESASTLSESQRGDEEEEANLENEAVAEEKKAAQCSTCVEDDTHNEEVCFTKSLDSLSSHTLLSEPPDIRNWFSSYAYESFVPDTCSMFKHVVSEENECEEQERVDFKTINEDKDLSDNVHPKGCVEHKSSSAENERVKQPCSRGDGSVERKRSLANSSNSHLEKILQPCKQDKAPQHNHGPAEYGETRLNQGSPGCSREAQMMSLDVNKGSDYRTAEIVQKNDMGEAKSRDKIQHDKAEMTTSLAKSFSARSPTCKRNKENDGFVSARKDKYPKANDENSWTNPENLSLQCSTSTGKVPLACEMQAAAKRKALTDATNVVQSNAMEITGKWRCPQKSKPYVGPPLKQLRLEKWVHRI